MGHFVYSTLSNDQNYTQWKLNPANEKDLATVEESVFIKGGKGVVHTKHAITPKYAVVTEVTDEQLAILERNEVFKLHIKNEFIFVVKDKKVDEKEITKDLAPKDKSAPKTPDDPEFLEAREGAAKLHSVGKTSKK